jgi:hypothetical protein
MDTEALGRMLVTLAALLCLATCALGEDGRWRPSLEAGWQALPDQVRAEELPRHLTVFDGAEAAPPPTQPPYSVTTSEGTVAFEVVGRVASPRTMDWILPVPQQDLSGVAYYVFRYRARGLARSYAPTAVLAVAGAGADGKAVTVGLIDVAQVWNDGLWHTVVGKAQFPLTVENLRVHVSTKDSLARLEIAGVELRAGLPRLPADLLGDSPLKPANRAQWQKLDLSGRCNDTCAAAFARVLDREGLVTDGGSELTARAGVPFDFATGKDVVRPDEDPGPDAEPVDFLGHQTTRHFYKPPGRDDAITIPVGQQASEVAFVMVAELPQGGPHYAISPRPYDFSDLGALAVELQYDQGEPDWAFPYSLADQGFAVRRMAGAYVVPADPARTLRSFALHNRLDGKTFSLAAVSVNTSPTRAFAQITAAPPPATVPTPPTPAARAPYVTRTGDTLTLGNGYYEVVADCRQGFALAAITNRWSGARLSLGPSSGLEVTWGDTLVTGRAFEAEAIATDARSATIVLRSQVPALPLTLTLRLTVDDTPQLKLNLTAISRGAAAQLAEVRFPVLRELRIGSVRDTWVCFPQYRNVLTDQPGHWRAPNDRSFPLQFMDVFNPRAGVGLALLTHNRDNARLDYSIAKDRAGVVAYVAASAEHHKLLPGQPVEFTEACLVAHAGDWHEAMRAYQDWLATWYRPVHAQDKAWFDKRFFLKTYLTTNKHYGFAFPLYDAEQRTYRVDEFVAAEQAYMGAAPEIAHLGGWCDLATEFQGDFLGGDYAVKDYTGGVAALRAAVRKFQDEHDVAVSLYMIPDRCSKQSEVGQRLGEQIACRLADGSAAQDERQWYLCPAVKAWQDHYVEAVQRTQRETGARAIYIDVFGYYVAERCYSPDHGHEVPVNTNQATLELIRRLREAVPPEVALWSEYPLPDQCAGYIDGNIHYYCLNWHEFFSETGDQLQRAPRFTPTPQNAYRFVFPRLRQFIFPCGSESWSMESQFAFFSGEALYDMGWFLYAGPTLERMQRRLGLQREYADGFSGDQPLMEVPTEQWEVHANAFPGQGRTAWTLFNARLTTVRGPVLAVDHQPGATYHDVWHDRPLQPAIRGGKAILALTLQPQELGCVVQARRDPAPSGDHP